MQKILWRKRGGVTIQYMVEDCPTPGTLGSHWLLLESYRWLEKTGNTQMLFNTYFLRRMKSIYGKLHCVYCGRRNLKIYHWMERVGKRRDMATADHFIAKSLDKELAMNESNLRVACSACNGRKSNHFWEEKFPYPKQKKEKYEKQDSECLRGH